MRCSSRNSEPDHIRLHDVRVENTLHPTCSECVCVYLSAAEAQHASASFNVYAHLWRILLQSPSNYARPEIPHYHCLLCCCALLCIVFYLFWYMCIFLVSVHANIGSTITNILIINIITQIPEGALLTCMPSTPSASSASSQILLSQRAQEAKSLGARPPFKSACLRGEKSRVPPTQPPSSAFPLQSPSFAPAASPPSSSLSTHARPGSALPE